MVQWINDISFNGMECALKQKNFIRLLELYGNTECGIYHNILPDKHLVFCILQG